MSVYTLALPGGRYYVGFSLDVETRVAQHFLGRGALWTRLYPPLRVEAVVPGDHSLENVTTIALMCRHGWYNVRGGSYTALDLKMPRPIGKAYNIRPPLPLPPVYEHEGHLITVREQEEGYKATVSGPGTLEEEGGVAVLRAGSLEGARVLAEQWVGGRNGEQAGGGAEGAEAEAPE